MTDPNADAELLSKPWRDARIVAFDLETTGTDTQRDRVIEIGVAVFERGEVVERWQQLVDPEVELPEVITRVTGITAADLVGKPRLADVADTLLGYLGSGVALAYNHEFDTRLLASDLARVGRSFEIARCLDPFPFCWENLRERQIIPNGQLGTVCNYLGVTLDSAHRADADAEAAGRVLFELPNHIVLPDLLGELLQVQRVLMRQVSEKFARFRRGRESGRGLGIDDAAIELGAAYIYGDEPDPIRALIARLPDVRDAS